MTVYTLFQKYILVYDGIYFVSKVYTIINRHIPPYTVIYDILVYTSICKDIISYFDIYEYMQWYHEISFHILTYTSICNDVVWHHIASYISIFPYDILVYQSILEVQRFHISKPSYYYDTIIRYYDTIMTLLWHYYDTIIVSIMTRQTIMTLLWHYYCFHYNTFMTLLFSLFFLLFHLWQGFDNQCIAMCRTEILNLNTGKWHLKVHEGWSLI